LSLLRPPLAPSSRESGQLAARPPSACRPLVRKPSIRDTSMIDLPPHLQPLVEDSQGGRMRLVAAWGGLSVESQIALLAYFREHQRELPNPIVIKALDSPIAYVRYLVASSLPGAHSAPESVSMSSEPIDQGLVERIASDPDLLVRYAPKESLPWTRLDY